MQLIANNQLKSDLELVKAKILIKLQQHLLDKSYGGSKHPLYEATVICLKKSLNLSVQQCDLSSIREIYYLLARVYNEQGEPKKRDEAATLFLTADEDMQTNMKHALGFICHFDLPSLITSEIQQISALKTKYRVTS